MSAIGLEQSDLSQVSDEKWEKAPDKAQAEYVLALNQHYLKWQEAQLHTEFNPCPDIFGHLIAEIE